MAQTWEQEVHSSETVAQRVRRELREDREGLRDDHRRMGEEVRSALELIQYPEQQDKDRSSANGIYPTDAGMFRLWRFKRSQIRLNYPVNINCEPRDEEGDPTAAKAAKRYLEHELTGQRWKMYADVRDRWVGAAIAMRAGCYRWDYCPELGDNGEIVARQIDSRLVSWPAGYLHPHDPLNPRLQILFRMPVNEARRQPNWKNTAGLKADGGFNELESMLSAPLENVTSDTLGEPSGPGGASDMLGGEGFFTGCITYYRFEGKVPPPTRPLKPGEQFMICSACGIESAPAQDIGPDFQHPPFQEMACPNCAGDMVRQEEMPVSMGDLKAAKGKRMVITALNGSVEKPLYDGPWQCPTARSFPIAWLTGYRFPHKRLPPSDPALHWTVTIGRNFTLTAIYKQAHRARGLWLLPSNGLEDRNGYRYDLGDDQDDVAFYDARDFPPQGISNIEPPPIQQALFGLHAMLSAAYTDNEGSSESALPKQQESKDVSGVSLEQQIETGNVPIDDFGQDVYDAEGISFGVLLDYIRWFGTKAKAIRFYNEKGVIEWESLRGADIPDMDVIVSAGPKLSQVRRDEIEAYSQLVSLPGPRRRRVAMLIGLDQQVVNDMNQDDKDTIIWQAELDAMAAQFGQAPGMNGGGGEMPPPITERMNPGAQAPMNGGTA